MSLKRGLLFYNIAALVLLLIVGHQDSRADMREQIGDADFVGWKMRAARSVASCLSEPSSARGAALE
jgi:hypothetical protein